jgi:hypothetical protein
MGSHSEFLDVAQVAALFHTTAAALYSQRHRRESPGALGIKVGKKLLFRRVDLDEFISREVESQTGHSADTSSVRT